MLYIRGDFYVCPNPLSCDPYSICELDCAYCFVKEMEQTILKNKAKKGLIPQPLTERELKTEAGKLATSGDLPVTIGRKCEPFCPSEHQYGTTFESLKLLQKYDVKTYVETKFSPPNDSYLKLMADMDTGVNLTLTPGTDSLCDVLEPNTPSYSQRWAFAKTLKDHGLWVSLKCEPLISGVNDYPAMLDEYAEKAVESGVDFVSFGDYRIHNPRLAEERLGAAGFDLVKILEGKKAGWPAIGKYFLDILHEKGLRCACTDWVNFCVHNDCVSCCGFEKKHNFNFQYAVNRIKKQRSLLGFSQMLTFNQFGKARSEKFRRIWNGEKGYYGLSDVEGIKRVGQDNLGCAVYAAVENKKLVDVLKC